MAKAKPNVKEKILDCAVQLLRGGGAKKLAQPQVAKAAGVPQGHLTYYFPRKSDLLAAVAERCLVAEDAEWAEVQADGGLLGNSPRKNESLKRVEAYLMDNNWNRMITGLIMEGDEDLQVHETVVTYMRGNRRRMARHLGLSEDDPLTEFIHAAYIGLGLRHFAYGDKVDEAATDRLIALVPKILESFQEHASANTLPSDGDSES